METSIVSSKTEAEDQRLMFQSQSQAVLAVADVELVVLWIGDRRRAIDACRAAPRVHGMMTLWPCALAMIEFKNLVLAVIALLLPGY
ncbi:hypothetical protein DL239_12560 [Sedimentitalea sp. CY04]|uniref:Uncharacterized protein n=1 Tax=Parasedimentitalea denitrificans TaxID=2211118 RepID=A0ABX0WAI4_9RHOB|nr:hypothetical protein [Sedimentitalea sp. CY04]